MQRSKGQSRTLVTGTPAHYCDLRPDLTRETKRLQFEFETHKTVLDWRKINANDLVSEKWGYKVKKATKQ